MASLQTPLAAPLFGVGLRLSKIQCFAGTTCLELARPASNWHDLPQIGTTCLKLARPASNWHGLPRIGTACLELARPASNWHGLPQIGTACLKLARPASNWHGAGRSWHTELAVPIHCILSLPKIPSSPSSCQQEPRWGVKAHPYKVILHSDLPSEIRERQGENQILIGKKFKKTAFTKNALKIISHGKKKISQKVQKQLLESRYFPNGSRAGSPATCG